MAKPIAQITRKVNQVNQTNGENVSATTKGMLVAPRSEYLVQLQSNGDYEVEKVLRQPAQ